MTITEISNIRGEVMNSFSNVEMAIAIYISKQYFGKANNDFIFEVLYDELVSFGALRHIFETLLKKNNILKEFPMDKIFKLSKIRNFFAHAWKDSPDDKDFSLIMPGKTKDQTPSVSELKREFDELYKEVHFQCLMPLITDDLDSED